MLVAPADVDDVDRTPDVVRSFAPISLQAMPFRSVVAASEDDPYIGLDRAVLFAHQWGASFRNLGEIIELAGCDLLTISPDLLDKLSDSYDPVERKLDPEAAKSANIERLELDEKKFRYLFNDNAMATEKTSEGIRKFAADIVKLEKFVASKLG